MIKREAGKFYRTRDGRRVGPMQADTWHPKIYLGCEVDGRPRSWLYDGTRQSIVALPELTIVAEWDDVVAFADSVSSSLVMSSVWTPEECVCRSLLHGHENGCSFARNVR